MKVLNNIYYKILFLTTFLVGSGIVYAQEKENELEDLILEDPVKYEAYYDYKSGKYLLYPKVGAVVVGTPIMMTAEEYTQYVMDKKQTEYYKQKTLLQSDAFKSAQQGEESKGFIPGIAVKSKLFETIFGGDRIEFRPSGFASIDLGILYQKIDNPQILPQNRKNFTTDIRQRIQMSLQGSVGKNLNLGVNYDTQAGFAFENKLNLAWVPGGVGGGLPTGASGGEDKIIKRIEFGNVSMPLSTGLITGAQSLFGVKGEFQFGNTNLTAVFSEQQSEARNITVQGGGVVNTFKLNIANYEENQHYFLDNYFRNNYDNALLQYPKINSTITITRMEVWRIDLGNSNLQEQRPILAVRDLGDSKNYNLQPDNSNFISTSTSRSVYSSILSLGNDIRNSSTVYNAINGKPLLSVTSTAPTDDENYVSGQNFVTHKRVKKLAETEYTYNTQLGYISLNQKLNNDQLLAVSYQYTDSKTPGRVYKVGEFSTETADVLVVKLLKPNQVVSTTSPMWDLMMKNIYSMEGTQISPEGFLLNVLYRDPSQGKINYIPDPKVQDQSIIELVNWDRLNQNNDISQDGRGDGIFDFVDGITIDAEKGKLIFTKTEPFGSYLSSLSIDPKYIFNSLYRNLKGSIAVTSDPLSERYTMEGKFKGTIGSGISLGAFNVPRGSVKVTANGQALTEGADYIVDYQMGTVTIINEAYKNSGVPINISLENQFAFNMQKKRFMGLNVEHKFSEEFIVGATFLNYKERPLTQKVQFGSEPVNNSILGMNMMLNKEMPFFTKLANWIPGVKTEAESNLSFKIEGATLIPGQNKTINDESYVDDFETTSSKISLKDPGFWGIASKPDIPEFQIGPQTHPLKDGFGRGLLSWYNIDPRFYGIGGGQPSAINNDALSLHLQRRVRYQEIFTNRDFIAGDQVYMNTFDVSFYPRERGPYNYNPQEDPSTFTDYANRWGGLMRPVSVTNFAEANVEYLEFWMMDPYADSANPNSEPLGANPNLIIQLGNVSEDVLKDGQLLYENGLTDNQEDITTTDWGRQPRNYPLVYAFDTEGEARRRQDVGYDGLSSADEASYYQGRGIDISNFTNYINPLTGQLDPAADDFVFYLNGEWDSSSDRASIVNRYKYFRNLEGNSPSNSLNASSASPDTEDLNKDFNLDETENYNQYRLSLAYKDLVDVTNPYIADRKQVDLTLENGRPGSTTWYLVRIPVSDYAKEGGGSLDILNNVRYIRMLMKGFTNTTTLRFATFDLVRSDWRRYEKEIANSKGDNTNDEGIGNQVDVQNVIISSVNLEENSTSRPPYVIPPGIRREVLGTTTGTQMQNESSLKLEIKSLREPEPRGIYKNIILDMRRYKKLKMFVHAENMTNPSDNSLDLDAKFFIRLGSDLSDNYYEYEIPLKYTSNAATSQFDIWPLENTIDIDLNDFVRAKNEKDRALNNYNSIERYRSNVTGDPNKAIYVKGRPSIGSISSIMMGVRNSNEGGPEKNLVLWLDELRLTDIDNEGGYAANASLTLNLADFAQITTSGNYQSVGFGALDSKPSERSQDETKQYAVNTAINVDKVLPEKWGLRIPVSLGISETFVDPKYNPIDNDVKLKDDPRKSQLTKVVRAYTSQKNFTVSNLRVDRTTGKKPKIYDIQNLSASFSFSNDYYRDIYTSYNIQQNLQASLNYDFVPRSQYYQPFSKWGVVQDTSRFARYLRLIKEININPVPSRISFRTDIARTYNEFQYRDINSYLLGTPNSYRPVFSNNFLFGWQYNIGFNLTRSFKIDYTSSTKTILDNIGNVPNDAMIWNSLFTSGRPINYSQRVQMNYRVPINYLPYLDFTSLELGYTGQYDWQASSTFLTRDPISYGNTAQNSQTVNVLGNTDFSRLYSYFKGYSNYQERARKRQIEIDSLNRAYEDNFALKSRRPFRNYKIKNKYKTIDYLWMFVGSLKRGQVQINENKGTILPGFLPEPNFFGVGRYGNSTTAPTFGFLFGSQFDIRNKAITEGWISQNQLMTDPYVRTDNSQLSASIQFEPINQLLIDLNIMRNHQKTLSQSGYNIINRDNQGNIIPAFENRTAMFSSTVISISTSFKSPDYIYSKMLANSRIFSERVALAQGQPIDVKDQNGYVRGYGLTNSEVLIPSFVSAFTGTSPEKQKLGYKRGFPIPNWRIAYGGLKNIPVINYWFKDFRINHSYVSNYTVNGVQTNPDFYQTIGKDTLDFNGNRYNYYSYGNVVMSEGFSPLIGFDMTMRNDMQIRIAYNKDRVYSLGLTNYTLQEDYGNEVVFGLGYIVKNVKLRLRSRGGTKTVQGDLNIRGDLSVRDNKTTIRRLVELDSQVTGGQNLVSIKFSTDYNFTKSFNLKFFYEQMITKYKISTAYPLSTIRAGLSATFTFGN